MKKVENKKVTIGKVEGWETTYKELIEASMVSSIAKEGLGWEDIKRRNRIDRILSEKGSTFTFEDADYEILKSMVAASRWRTHGQEIEDFMNYIADGGLKETTKKK